VTQFGYYLVIILLGLGNLALAVIAYRQRDKQIKGNALRETQVELAELRNELAERRLEYLRMQVELLREIRDAVTGDGEPGGVSAVESSARATTSPTARTSRRSRRPPHAPA
jgi:hypothetical protein